MAAKKAARAKSKRSRAQDSTKDPTRSSDGKKTKTNIPEQAEKPPQPAQTDIQRLVQQRTAELARVSEQLSREIENRKLAEERIRLVGRLTEDLLRPGSLQEKMSRITDAVVQVFEADFARVWITKPGDLCDSGCFHANATEGPHACRRRDQCLHLAASSGRYTHTDGKRPTVPRAGFSPT